MITKSHDHQMISHGCFANFIPKNIVEKLFPLDRSVRWNNDKKSVDFHIFGNILRDLIPIGKFVNS